MEKEAPLCYHCDTQCSDIISYDDKSFCCTGCKTVYSLLSENNLDNYYALNSSPGIKNSNDSTSSFEYLDLVEVQEKLLRFREDGIARVKLMLPQIHCSSCLWLLERLNKLHPGVLSSEVFFQEKEAEITFQESEISLKQLAILLQSIGYEPKISKADLNPERKAKKDYSRILKIGVTGFCFGNIMLLSFPEYVGITESDKDFQNTFNYLNVLFALPVLLYGSREYFVSAFKALRARSVNIDVPISLGIIALFSRSIFEIFSGYGAGYLDSFAGLIFFLLIGKWFQQKTYAAISFERDFKSYFPIASARIIDEEEEMVPLDDIKPGDCLVIRNNELIPTDAVLISGEGRIDYSFVTGESEPISKRSGDKLYAGGRQFGQAIQIQVIKEVENSYLTRLWNNPIFHKKERKVSLADRVSKVFTVALIVIALVAGIVWSQIDSSRAAFVVTSVLIVACPCAIALSVPFTYGNIIRLLGRRSIYLRAVDVIEPMSAITDVVFDKTGTLTEPRKSKVEWEGRKLSDLENDSIHQITNQSTHPLSRLIASFLVPNHAMDIIDEMKEIEGFGIEAVIEGVQWRIGSAKWLCPEQESNQTSVFVQKDGVLLGHFTMSNVYREEVKELFTQLEKGHVIHILSGDNDSERVYLTEIFGDELTVRFNQSPEDKLEYVRSLQEQGKTVMMLGDGLNDAGALKQADVGVAVADDVYTFTPSSDAIIEGGKLRRLMDYMDFSKYGIRVVKISYAFSLAYNLIGLGFALTGYLTPLVAAILMPLSSISIVLLVTTLTNLKARTIE